MGMRPINRPAQPAYAGYQRSPELQARMDAFGADQKLAEARARYAAQFGRPPPTAGGPISQRPQGGLFSGIQRVAQAAQQRQAAPAPTPAAPMTGGRPQPRGRVAGYADGGKVIDRKPNGKKC